MYYVIAILCNVIPLIGILKILFQPEIIKVSLIDPNLKKDYVTIIYADDSDYISVYSYTN